MNQVAQNADPTWAREITFATPAMPNRAPKCVTGAVIFVVSSIAVGAVVEPPISWESASTRRSSYVREYGPSLPFVPTTYDRAWASAMSVIRDLGEDPDSLVRQAGETLEFWRSHPFRGEMSSSAVDDDEI